MKLYTKIDIDGYLDSNKFEKFLSDNKGKEIFIKAEIVKDNRSILQNNYLWAIYQQIGDDLGYEKDEIHELCKEIFIPKVVEIIEKNIMGQVQHKMVINGEERQFSTAELPKKAFMDYIEKIRIYFGVEFGITIPTPEEYLGGPIW